MHGIDVWCFIFDFDLWCPRPPRPRTHARTEIMSVFWFVILIFDLPDSHPQNRWPDFIVDVWCVLVVPPTVPPQNQCPECFMCLNFLMLCDLPSLPPPETLPGIAVCLLLALMFDCPDRPTPEPMPGIDFGFRCFILFLMFPTLPPQNPCPELIVLCLMFDVDVWFPRPSHSRAHARNLVLMFDFDFWFPRPSRPQNPCTELIFDLRLLILICDCPDRPTPEPMPGSADPSLGSIQAC